MKHPRPPGRAEILAELRRQLEMAGTRGPVKCTVTLARAILAELEEPAPAGAEMARMVYRLPPHQR